MVTVQYSIMFCEQLLRIQPPMLPSFNEDSTLERSIQSKESGHCLSESSMAVFSTDHFGYVASSACLWACLKGCAKETNVAKRKRKHIGKEKASLPQESVIFYWVVGVFIISVPYASIVASSALYKDHLITRSDQ